MSVSSVAPRARVTSLPAAVSSAAAPEPARPTAATPDPSRRSSGANAIAGADLITLDSTRSQRTLRLGMSGADVRELNARLASFGYGVSASSDVFSQSTVKAVKSFQKSNGLAADGVVGPKTAAKLNLAGTPTDPGTDIPAPATPSAPTAPVTGSLGITRTLKLGATGDDVRVLNQRLADLHYAGVDASSSTYSQGTKDAVMAFQKVNGIARDGVAGPQTLRTFDAPASFDLAGRGGNRLIVDVSQQVAVLVRNGAIAKIVNASTAAAGQSPTPRGDHQVVSKVAGNHPRKQEQMFYSSFFQGNFAVHGNPNVPNYPASHGCVRIPMALAKEIFTDMPSGFSVTVRD